MPPDHHPVLIILAGGKSSRMGVPKGLLPYKDSYWILDQIAAFTVSGSAPVFIGLGYDHQAYFDAIPWFEKAVESPQDFEGKKVQVIVNHQPEFGLFSTLRSILKVVYTTHKKEEVLVLPVDVPMLRSSELERIIAIENAVVIPEFNKKNGHPVKLHPDFWKSLLDIDITDINARLDIQIKELETSKVSVIEVKDDSILKNLNTPETWKAFIC